MPSIIPLLHSLGFAAPLTVQDQVSITHLIPQRARYGIYVLHLSDDTYYVGLSKDVTERFRQHKLCYPDIVALSFKQLRHDPVLLRAEERKIIYQLDAADVPLLNKLHNTISYGSSSFDVLLSPQIQSQWLASGMAHATQLAQERKPVKPEKLARDKRNIATFQDLPYCQHIATALKKYIVTTIPVWKQTEGRYWSMSCVPSTNGGWRAAAVSLSYMEAFVIFKDGSCFLNLASTVFREAYATDAAFNKAYPDTAIEVIGYEAAGFDQLNIRTHEYKTTLAVLDDLVVQKGARFLNLSLVRQRATLYSGSHSPMLTGFVMEQ